VAINDRNILISDHVIDNINCTNGKINWGIGIGLAGSTYDNDYPKNKPLRTSWWPTSPAATVASWCMLKTVNTLLSAI
jgi:hypothetical protein